MKSSILWFLENILKAKHVMLKCHSKKLSKTKLKKLYFDVLHFSLNPRLTSYIV